MSLKTQCEDLGIELTEIALEYSGRPEDAALSYYEKMGYQGTIDEGYTFRTALKALILDELHEINTFNDRSDACVRYLEAQMKIHEDKTEHLISSSSKTRKRKFKSNMKEISKIPYIRQSHPDLSLEVATLIYQHFRPEILSKLLLAFSVDPYGYRSGWPDLTIGNKKQIELVEIKTTDKLHGSQLYTIPMLMSILPCKISVVRIVKDS